MNKRIFASVLSLLLLTPTTALAAGSASFTWSQNSISVEANAETSVQLILNTAGTNTTGVDAVLNFDPTKIQISSVSFSNPNLYANNFSNVDVGTGIARISGTFTDVSSKYTGTASFVTITVKGLELGATSLTWSCTDGATNDSNIMQQTTAADVINCGGLTPLSVMVGQSTSTGTSTDSTTPTTTSNDAQGSSTTSCSALQSSPTNLVAKAISNSSVLLTWTKESNAGSYTLKYGTSANSYQYGASNIGNSGSFMVNYLRPNTTYYFAIAGVNSCSTSSFVTASTKTSGGTVAAAPVKNNTPSFTNLVTQVAQTAPVPLATIEPIVEQKLPQTTPDLNASESFLPGKSQTASVPEKKLPILPVAVGAVAVVTGGGILYALLRMKKSTPVVTTIVENQPPTPVPPLGG